MGYALCLFTVPVLNNLRLSYLRGLGENVVLIHNQLGNSGATGFLIKGKSKKTYIMTNNHVCELEKKGVILADYLGDTYVTTVIKRYPLNDLCVMKAPRNIKNVFKTASDYNIGDTAYTIGHPALEPLSVSVGELSDSVFIPLLMGYNFAPEECLGPTYSLHTDLPPEAIMFGIFNACVRTLEANTSSIIIIPGNSGSPTVNIYGRVVGVAFAANEAGTRSYHVPLSYLKDFLDSL